MTVPHEGDFYIRKSNANFFLRINSAWTNEGQLVRAHVLGLTSEGPFPFTNLQTFELALSETNERYHQDFSLDRSEVRAIFPTAGSCDLVLTDNLGRFLGHGEHIICTAHFEGVAQIATLAFNDVIVPAFTPLWVVMPAIADPTMAGVRCLFASEPV